MELTEFLLARIAEDEAVARAAAGSMYRIGPEGAPLKWHAKGANNEGIYITPRPDDGQEDEGTYRNEETAQITRWSPGRVLAECEAKTGVIEAAWADHCQIEGEWGTGKSREQMEAADDYPEVIQRLALPYADHPDYRQEWKP